MRSKKITPQEVYEAYRDATYNKRKQEWNHPRALWELPPATWEEVSMEDRAFYARVAFKVNSVFAEFREENKR